MPTRHVRTDNQLRKTRTHPHFLLHSPFRYLQSLVCLQSYPALFDSSYVQVKILHTLPKVSPAHPRSPHAHDLACRLLILLCQQSDSVCISLLIQGVAVELIPPLSICLPRFSFSPRLFLDADAVLGGFRIGIAHSRAVDRNSVYILWWTTAGLTYQCAISGLRCKCLD